MGTIDMRERVTPNDGEGEAAPEETKQPDPEGEPVASFEAGVTRFPCPKPATCS